MPAEEHLQYVPQPPGVALRFVSWGAIASLLLVVFAVGVFYEIYHVAVPIETMQPPQRFAAPRVVTHATDVAELHRLADEQSQRLKTWGWVNEQHTLIQIPIARAMRLLTQKGGDAWNPLLPSQPTLSASTSAAQQANTPASQKPSGSPPAPEKQP